MPKFLVSLSIPQLGEETALDIARAFGSLGALRSASLEELQKVSGVGGIVAESIHGWFREPVNEKLIDNLLKYIDVGAIKKLKKESLSLFGKTFVLTGTLENMSRDEAKKYVHERGGDVSGSISKETDYLVMGEDPGSKLEKAKKLGIKTIDEEEFSNLIK
ncbi:MAG: hypothetical protein IIC67_04685 [Thaumarchaeota archaeon]|nr:hypothetical protein [Nitrososphaerota archaeon]